MGLPHFDWMDVKHVRLLFAIVSSHGSLARRFGGHLMGMTSER